MASAIEWTGETLNPVRARLLAPGSGAGAGEPARIGWHCEHASPGCANCYAEALNRAGRSRFTGTRLAYKPGHRKDVEIFLDERVLLTPLRWRRPRTIFWGSMTDLFAHFVTDDMLDRMFAVMALTPQHTHQLLTKRSARMRAYVLRQRRGRPAPQVAQAALELWKAHRQHRGGSGYLAIPRSEFDTPNLICWPLPNVWLGVSVEDQRRAAERIPDLLATPAAVRFLSCEPLLGPVDLTRWMPPAHHHPDNEPSPALDRLVAAARAELRRRHPEAEALDWIICGGESGPRARPMHPDWARALRDQCAAAGVPFLFKQWGEWAPKLEGDDDRHLHQWVLPPDSPRAGLSPSEIGGALMRRVGKKEAGRELDGVVHDAMPPVGCSKPAPAEAGGVLHDAMPEARG